MNVRGIRSLLKCIPSSVASNLTRAIPNPIPAEFHGLSMIDQTGKIVFKLPYQQVKEVTEIAKCPDGFASTVAYRDRLRDILLEGVPVQWGKKCVRYKETEMGVWVFFDDGSQEFCDILVGADGIFSSSKHN